MEDYLLFLKYNNTEIRRAIRTDYYTDQEIEKVQYNCEKAVINYLKGVEEIHGKK